MFNDKMKRIVSICVAGALVVSVIAGIVSMFLVW